MTERRPYERRLTLAPLPATEEGVVETSEQECVALVADPLAAARRKHGSRFWVLADEVSSVEEAGIVERPSLPSSALTAKASAGLQEAKVWGLFSAAGTEGAPSSTTVRSRQSGGRPATKPWRGPLPVKRVSPRLTLGDVLAAASKAVEGRAPPSRHEPVWELKATPSSVAATSNFENRHHPRDPGDGLRDDAPNRTWTVLGRSINISNAGKTARFTGSAGLEYLFAQTGRLRTRVLSTSTTAASNPSINHQKHVGEQMQGSGARAGGRGTPRWEADRTGRGRGRGPDHGGLGGGRGRGYGYDNGGVEEEIEELVGSGDFGDTPYAFDPGHEGYGSQGRGALLHQSYRQGPNVGT